jgi:hypothetical protein
LNQYYLLILRQWLRLVQPDLLIPDYLWHLLILRQWLQLDLLIPDYLWLLWLLEVRPVFLVFPVVQ